MSHICVTGANGFVGRALCHLSLDQGHQVTALVRQRGGCVDGVREWLCPGQDFTDIETAQWPSEPIDTLVHAAARVHVMNERMADPLAAFRATNVEGALRIARQAHARGVKRFVFVSSIKAVAEISTDHALREDDAPQPQDPYGQSKYEAEQALRRFGESSGLDIVIVRPPLVYGPGVGANFLRLMRAIVSGMPLPLVRAKRSMVYIDNLASALLCCAFDPRAAHGCFHVADGDDLTVVDLARALGQYLHRPARLIPVPGSWLRLAGRLTNRSAQARRLSDELRVDATRIRVTLDWQPPYTIDQGLAATATWYSQTQIN